MVSQLNIAKLSIYRNFYPICFAQEIKREHLRINFMKLAQIILKPAKNDSINICDRPFLF